MFWQYQAEGLAVFVGRVCSKHCVSSPLMEGRRHPIDEVELRRVPASLGALHHDEPNASSFPTWSDVLAEAERCSMRY